MFATGGVGVGGLVVGPTHICPKQNAKHITTYCFLIWGLTLFSLWGGHSSYSDQTL